LRAGWPDRRSGQEYTHECTERDYRCGDGGQIAALQHVISSFVSSVD
jgi:hypothetical protein